VKTSFLEFPLHFTRPALSLVGVESPPERLVSLFHIAATWHYAKTKEIQRISTVKKRKSISITSGKLEEKKVGRKVFCVKKIQNPH
jgi:hypothetical protein